MIFKLDSLNKLSVISNAVGNEPAFVIQFAERANSSCNSDWKKRDDSACHSNGSGSETISISTAVKDFCHIDGRDSEPTPVISTEVSDSERSGEISNEKNLQNHPRAEKLNST